MKTIIIAACLTGVFATQSQAQMKQIAQATPVTKIVANATTDKANPMSFEELASISRGAVRQSIADNLTQAAEKLVADNVEGRSDILRSGKAMDLNTTINSGQTILEQHSVNVHVEFDARPIGGILNVRVQLVPVFGGIGSATRPVVSREFAEAVDNFDDDVLAQTVSKLTKELAAEYAQNN